MIHQLITVNGNISASGIITGSNLSGTNTGDQNISNLAITGSDVVFNNITASGNISASGTIEATSFTGSYQGTFTQVTGLTITSQSWGGASSLYSSSLSNSNILANSSVEVIPSNTDYSVVLAAQFLPENSGSSGKVTVFAVNQPTDDVGVTINIFN